ncbi:MAG: hypothetical protein FJY44_11385, partial [Betaproteobacteria bacterium]|nr:hypothetical protein [Betaproteobacteria bacterium]
MHPFHVALVIYAALALIGFAFVLRWERRHFSAKGLGGSWLRVRLASIPVLLVTAALVVLPARGSSGMEGLALFYGLLIVAAPLLWFGMHWAVGRMMQPPLAFGDSALVAGSPLLYALAAASVAHPLQSLAWS